jgi:ABC-2 type transport system ATP-binding protein
VSQGAEAVNGSAGGQGDGVTPDSIVVAERVTKRYGSFEVLRGLDLAVAEGTIFGFVGPSGSGKTTTVRLLTGSQQPSSGTVTVFGHPPTRFTPVQRMRMGYMPQLSVLYPQLSLEQNLRFVASIYGLSRSRRQRREEEVLDFVVLTNDRHKQLQDTSGGMQRRLALAAALIHDPELLFLDEPTAGIDPVLRRKFWDHFDQLRQDGRTLFITTQYVGEAGYCDRIGMILDGRLLAVDTADGLRRRAYGGQILNLVARTRLDESTISDLTALDFITKVERTGVDGRALRIIVDYAATAIPRLQQYFAVHHVDLQSIREHVPELDDVFVKLVQAERP